MTEDAKSQSTRPTKAIQKMSHRRASRKSFRDEPEIRTSTVFFRYWLILVMLLEFVDYATDCTFLNFLVFDIGNYIPNSVQNGVSYYPLYWRQTADNFLAYPLPFTPSDWFTTNAGTVFTRDGYNLEKDICINIEHVIDFQRLSSDYHMLLKPLVPFTEVFDSSSYSMPNQTGMAGQGNVGKQMSAVWDKISQLPTKCLTIQCYIDGLGISPPDIYKMVARKGNLRLVPGYVNEPKAPPQVPGFEPSMICPPTYLSPLIRNSTCYIHACVGDKVSIFLPRNGETWGQINNEIINARGSHVWNSLYSPPVFDVPIIWPSFPPTASPSTAIPSPLPSTIPSPAPTPLPSLIPTPHPSTPPTIKPTPIPSTKPSGEGFPTPEPTRKPTKVPSAVPTSEPSPNPSVVPTPVPSPVPTAYPLMSRSVRPSRIPTPVPTYYPSTVPTPYPSLAPSFCQNLSLVSTCAKESTRDDGVFCGTTIQVNIKNLQKIGDTLIEPTEPPTPVRTPSPTGPTMSPSSSSPQQQQPLLADSVYRDNSFVFADPSAYLPINVLAYKPDNTSVHKLGPTYEVTVLANATQPKATLHKIKFNISDYYFTDWQSRTHPKHYCQGMYGLYVSMCSVFGWTCLLLILRVFINLKSVIMLDTEDARMHRIAAAMDIPFVGLLLSLFLSSETMNTYKKMWTRHGLVERLYGGYRLDYVMNWDLPCGTLAFMFKWYDSLFVLFFMVLPVFGTLYKLGQVNFNLNTLLFTGSISSRGFLVLGWFCCFGGLGLVIYRKIISAQPVDETFFPYPLITSQTPQTKSVFLGETMKKVLVKSGHGRVTWGAYLLQTMTAKDGTVTHRVKIKRKGVYYEKVYNHEDVIFPEEKKQERYTNKIIKMLTSTVKDKFLYFKPAIEQTRWAKWKVLDRLNRPRKGVKVWEAVVYLLILPYSSTFCKAVYAPPLVWLGGWVIRGLKYLSLLVTGCLWKFIFKNPVEMFCTALVSAEEAASQKVAEAAEEIQKAAEAAEEMVRDAEEAAAEFVRSGADGIWDEEGHEEGKMEGYPGLGQGELEQDEWGEMNGAAEGGPSTGERWVRGGEQQEEQEDMWAEERAWEDSGDEFLEGDGELLNIATFASRRGESGLDRTRGRKGRDTRRARGTRGRRISRQKPGRERSDPDVGGEKGKEGQEGVETDQEDVGEQEEEEEEEEELPVPDLRKKRKGIVKTIVNFSCASTYYLLYATWQPFAIVLHLICCLWVVFWVPCPLVFMYALAMILCGDHLIIGRVLESIPQLNLTYTYYFYFKPNFYALLSGSMSLLLCVFVLVGVIVGIGARTLKQCRNRFGPKKAAGSNSEGDGEGGVIKLEPNAHLHRLYGDLTAMEAWYLVILSPVYLFIACLFFPITAPRFYYFYHPELDPVDYASFNPVEELKRKKKNTEKAMYGFDPNRKTDIKDFIEGYDDDDDDDDDDDEDGDENDERVNALRFLDEEAGEMERGMSLPRLEIPDSIGMEEHDDDRSGTVLSQLACGLPAMEAPDTSSCTIH